MKILVHAGGSYGDVSPYINLAVRLKTLGHEPMLVVPDEYVEECRRNDFPVMGYINFNIDGLIWSSYENFMFWCLTRLMKDSLSFAREIVEFSQSAELVISHPLCPVGGIVSDYYKIPIVDLLISSVYFQENEMSYNFYNNNWLEPLNDCRFSLGLNAVSSTSLSVFRNNNLKITLFPESLIPGTVSRNLVYGNFIHYYQDIQLSEELEQFLSEGIPIGITLGQSIGFLTYPTDFMEIIEKLADTGKRILIFSDKYNTDNPNIFICKGTAPHHKIFPRCSVVINHGGIGTIAKCIESNTPQIIVPQMSENACNAEYFTELCEVIQPSNFNLETLLEVLNRDFYDYEIGEEYRRMLTDVDGLDIIIETLRNHKYLNG